jgi:hypothetical protein
MEYTSINYPEQHSKRPSTASTVLKNEKTPRFERRENSLKENDFVEINQRKMT